MLSMPPATITRPSPARSASMPIITVFMPLPHILLTVEQGTLSGRPGAEGGLAGRRLALARRQHAAHQHLGDVLGLDAGALERGLDGDGAELGRGRGRKLALKAAHGRARGADDHDTHRILLQPFRPDDSGQRCGRHPLGASDIAQPGDRGVERAPARPCSRPSPRRARRAPRRGPCATGGSRRSTGVTEVLMPKATAPVRGRRTSVCRSVRR